MACCLPGTNPQHEPMVIYCQPYPEEQTSERFDSKHFCKENALENAVWKTVIILLCFGSQYVDPLGAENKISQEN